MHVLSCCNQNQSKCRKVHQFRFSPREIKNNANKDEPNRFKVPALCVYWQSCTIPYPVRTIWWLEASHFLGALLTPCGCKDRCTSGRRGSIAPLNCNDRHCHNHPHILQTQARTTGFNGLNFRFCPSYPPEPLRKLVSIEILSLVWIDGTQGCA